jgi:CheY-like chemotaxis protein
VLNVENHPGSALLVESLLERRSDLRLLTARTGNEGCAMALSFRPDMILMDIGLSDLSGFEVLKILQGNPATAHIPVIAVSSDSYPHQIDKGLRAGFFRYLTKPYRLYDLMKAIDDALRHAADGQSPPRSHSDSCSLYRGRKAAHCLPRNLQNRISTCQRWTS